MITTILKNFGKVEPLCPVFGECGGCLYQDIDYPEELLIKESTLQKLFEDNLGIPRDVFEPIVASPKTYHYRNRVDLKIIRTRSKHILMGFSSKLQNHLIPLDTCYIAREEIANDFTRVKEQAVARLSAKYHQANVVVRTDDTGRVFWGGIGKGSLRLKDDEYLHTEIGGRKIFYSLDTFFQANLHILPKLFERIGGFDFWKEKPVFYDLYGGVGLFSIGLIDKLKKAYLIEECDQSLAVANYSKVFHKLSNLEIIDGPVETEFPKGLARESGDFQVAMVDPPRAGLSKSVVELINLAAPLKYLIYLSCSPKSLVRDLKLLEDHWQIQKIMPFDFFPRTGHLETLVLLKNNRIS